MNPDPKMIDAVTSVADHASAQSDRWLFVALLIVGGVSAILAGRWLAARYEAMLETWRADMKAMQTEIAKLHSERIAAMEKYGDDLKEVVRLQGDDAKAMLRDFSALASRNSEALGGVTKALVDLQNSCSLTRQNQK